MNPIIDHLQITVKDLTKAELFYDQLMPILGFDLGAKSKGKVEAHELEVIEYSHSNFIFAVSSPRHIFRDEAVHRRKPGAIHHIAFRASSEKEVDEAYRKIKTFTNNIVAPPQFYPQHGTHYYALFFKDDDGIKLEIVYENRLV
jgi:catechol 2,3-dioxygenase-like lactoylglutathione lyase family enzyme